MRMQFGYCPKELDFSVGNISVSTLEDHDKIVRELGTCDHVESRWYYAPIAASKDFMSGVERTLPYSARVFGLPQTHAIEHHTSTDVEQLRFLIWMLGFILGIRLSETEAGFLDATPIETGVLHDIVWSNKSEQKALGIADAFWQTYNAEPRITKGILGIIHSLFLSQTPNYLDFEKFTYLYVALDACHYVHSKLRGQNPKVGRHFERISNLCSAFNCPVPNWADPNTGTVFKHRNETLHEGLFFDEPLGFRIYGSVLSSNKPPQCRNMLLEMQNLVNRFVCALVGFNDTDYITSSLNTRSCFNVQLR